MANNLDLLFPGMRVEDCEIFRVTRNAIYDVDEDMAHDLLELIEVEIADPCIELLTLEAIGRMQR